jgi:hypothetical protein
VKQNTEHGEGAKERMERWLGTKCKCGHDRASHPADYAECWGRNDNYRKCECVRFEPARETKE